jgi:hypothetical protein
MLLFVKRFDCVHHDITAEGNIPANSNYDVVQDRHLPKTSKSLLSFTSLCFFISVSCNGSRLAHMSCNA